MCAALRKHIVDIIMSRYIMRIYYARVARWYKIKEYVFTSGSLPALRKGLKTITAHLVYTIELSLAVQSRACNSGDSY